jgi:hypothetical protein
LTQKVGSSATVADLLCSGLGDQMVSCLAERG